MSATKVPQGWMSKAERKWLGQRGAEIERKGVEVGSWKGRSTLALAGGMRTGARLYAVDTWAGVPDDPIQQERLYKNTADAFTEFQKNLKAHINAGRVAALKMTSLAAAAFLRKRYGAGSLDFVFIDADHRYESVRADITAWLPMVRAGGLLAGHDMHWEGVRDAVSELVPAAKFGPDTIWWLRV